MTTVSSTENLNVTTEALPTIGESDYPDYGMFGITEKMFDDFSNISNIYLNFCICLPGIIGNAIGLVVLKGDSERRKMTTYVYLLSLFVVDTLNLLYGFLKSILHVIENVDWSIAEKINSQFFRYRGYIGLLLNHVIAAMIIVMSLERLMALVRPFHVNSSVLVRYPKTIIFASFLVSSVYLSPFIYGMQAFKFLNAANRTVYLPMERTDLKGLINALVIIETIVLHFFAPTFLLIINVGIAVAYSRFNRLRTKVVKADQLKIQAKLTLTVIFIAGFYIILSLPNVFVQTLIFVDSRYRYAGEFRMTLRFFLLLGELLTRINSSIDFVIYILSSPRYRYMLRNSIFKSVKSKHDSS